MKSFKMSKGRNASKKVGTTGFDGNCDIFSGHVLADSVIVLS